MARGQFTFIASSPRLEQASAAGRAFGLRDRSNASQCLPPTIGRPASAVDFKFLIIVAPSSLRNFKSKTALES
jgi:hypothetical protein